MNKLITTNDAAERLGVSPVRVRALITAGRLPAQKMGRDYFIEESDLRLVENRTPGRPSKAKVKANVSKRAGKS